MKIALWLLPALLACAAASAADVSGQKIFTERKCAHCHTVTSEGIQKVAEPADEDEEDKAGDEPPDLSGVGGHMTAEQMDGWLRKKLAIDGARHPKRFAGSDEERKVLIDWLRQTKPAAKAPK
jgi:mono/diheme cytochrome c family protein